MQFTQGLHRALQLHPDKTATLYGDRQFTFRQLADRVARMASGFTEAGIPTETPIAMLGFNSDYYLHYYLACAWGGFIVNPVNFRWNIAEIIYSLKDSASGAIILDDSFVHFAEQIKAECPSIKSVFYCGSHADQYPGLIDLDTLISNSAPIDDRGIRGNALFGIFYTGGTTGFPKGVLLTHNNICSSPLGLLAEGTFPEGGTGLHAAPMFHLADMAQTVCLLLRGNTHAILPNFTPEKCLQAIARYKVTDLLIVPTMLQMVIESPQLNDHDISSLQRIYYGGSPFTEAGLDKTMQRLPNVSLRQVYGMTESSAIITFLPWEAHLPENRHKNHLRSGGRPTLHTQVKIVDEHDQSLANGQVGEIIFRSPGMMQGYLNKPEETASALRNGWMHTGDMGYMDDEGYVFVIDRLKDMIISGGENIYCTEVENVVATHPAVKTCAVFGIPSDEWGEMVHAAVVLHEGSSLTLEQLIQHCRQTIAGYKCPRSLSLHDALPLTGAGKVKKNELRDPYWTDKH